MESRPVLKRTTLNHIHVGMRREEEQWNSSMLERVSAGERS